MNHNSQTDIDYRQILQKKRSELLNGRPLYEKDIDMIVEKVLQRLSVSMDLTKVIQESKELRRIIDNLGGK